MEISPDATVYWEYGFVKINATLVFTWAIMAFMTIVAWLVTRKPSTGPEIPRWQNAIEVIVTYIRNQLREIMNQEPTRYMYFVGTLFLFISISNLLVLLPPKVYQPPTGSLSTTAALATCVFVAVPFYGITEQGVRDYLKHYIQPTPLMLPFTIISELSRTLALAVRLFGNIMSGTLIGAILLSLAPFFVPVIMNGFGLLIGQIHAYIFAVLAAVYIASATKSFKREESKKEEQVREEREHG